MTSAQPDDPAWRVLQAAGVPLGPPRPSGPERSAPLDFTIVAAALQAVVAAPLNAREHDALAAWLCAMQDHWPSAHARLLQSSPALLNAGDVEPGRLLKLRRLALSYLAPHL